MTIQIKIEKADNSNNQAELIQINNGSETNLGTLESGQPRIVTLHSGQSFTVRERAEPVGANDSTDQANAASFGTASLGSPATGTTNAGGVEVPGSNMSTGRTIR